MGKSTKGPPYVYTEEDRRQIGEARETLQRFGLYVDVADMSDVAYERRNCRMKAMDLVAALAQYVPPHTKWVVVAKIFEDYIWEGKVPDGDI